MIKHQLEAVGFCPQRGRQSRNCQTGWLVRRHRQSRHGG